MQPLHTTQLHPIVIVVIDTTARGPVTKGSTSLYVVVWCIKPSVSCLTPVRCRE